MKKIILLSVLFILPFAYANAEYVDLGLPSGTLWNDVNEGKNFRCSYSDAVVKFEENLPTKEQFEELVYLCKWLWTGKGYKVEGLNGNCIYIPAAGFRDCDGYVLNSGMYGFYWSSSLYDINRVYYLYFDVDKVKVYYGRYDGHQTCGRSIRLVK